MVVEVVPRARTPRGKNVFTYRVADGAQVVVGDLVEVTFGKRQVPALVWNSIADGQRAFDEDLKEIGAVYAGETRWSTVEQRELLVRWSDHYGVSLPTALLALQSRSPLRRPARTTIPVTFEDGGGEAGENTQAGVESVRRDAQRNRAVVVRYTAQRDVIALLSRLREDGIVLVIVADKAEAVALAHTLPGPVHIASERPSPTYWNAVRTSSPTGGVIIGTKQHLLRNCEGFSYVVLHNEELRFHAQSDRHPYYHSRGVATLQSAIVPVLFTSTSPSLDTHHRAEQHDWPVHTLGERTTVTLVDMHEERQKDSGIGWFSGPIRSALQGGDSVLCILNRAGGYGSATCAACETLLPISARRCTSCGKDRIIYRRAGTQVLESELRVVAEGRRVVRVDGNQQDRRVLEDAAVAGVVIGTELALRYVQPERFDRIVVLSADHLLAYPHYKAHERVHQMISRLQSYGPPVLVQTYVPHHPVLQALANGSYETYIADESAVRSLVQAPPWGGTYTVVRGDRERVGQRVDLVEELGGHVVVRRSEES